MKLFKKFKKEMKKKEDLNHPLISSTNFDRHNQYFKSYSQAGEDGIVRFLLNEKKINLADVNYLDIGARFPILINNTYMFYEQGASGVLVEGDIKAIESLKAIRPRDIVLHRGVTDQTDEYGEFYYSESGGSTLDKEEATERELAGQQQVLEVYKVKLARINDLIKDNFETYPTILSTDIEGMDLRVLKTLDFETYPIPILIVETCTYSTNHIREKEETIAEFIKTKNYIVYGDTRVNTIFVNKDWFYSE